MAGPQALMADHADCFDGDPGCGPTGAHQKHGGYSCTVCHKYAGRLVFDSTSAAYKAGQPKPTFNAVTKTCSNVGCHSVPSGTFSYWSPACEGTDAECTVTVSYGNSGGTTPSWYATGTNTCGGCHSFPARLANGSIPVWHSGLHGINIPNGNACQLCHPDVTGAYVYGGLPSFVGTSAGLITSCATGTYCSSTLTIANPLLHGNGTVDVAPGFRSTCFGCH
jgi:hypothetical protein